jgi:glycosyltransferase involved in cell wall biosynthesis
MQLLYAATYDARDVHQWSGLGAYIGRALEEAGLEMDYVNVGPPTLAERAASRALTVLLGRTVLVDREPYVARRRAQRVAAGLHDGVDLVFSPGTMAIGALAEGPPTAFWADATFAGIAEFYPSLSRIHPRTRRVADELERRALGRCSAAIYASDWAAASAVSHYDADPDKVHVVPFGANLDGLPNEDDVRGWIAGRAEGPCQLLFVGVSWQRKGGDLAIETARLLNERGVPTELTVVGATPPTRLPEFVRSLGFVSKSTEADRLRSCYRSAHFLLLPTRAECLGVVFSEASAFGVPSLATDVGGVSTAVRNGVNGRLLPLDASPADYADVVEAGLADYEAQALRAFDDHRTRLSWSIGGAEVRRILERIT